MRSPTVFIVDDDPAVRDSLRLSLLKSGLSVEDFASAEEFLNTIDLNRPGCLVLDIRMPGMNGLDLQQALVERQARLPIIFITGHGDVPAAVQAMKNGAVDFLEKPYYKDALLARIAVAFERNADQHAKATELAALRARYQQLTPREREVMAMLVAGAATTSNRQIGEQLGISRRTVDNYRAALMEKTQARSLADLVDIAQRLGVYQP